MQAYLNFRASIKPVLCTHITDFSKNYEFTKKHRGTTELYDMRQVLDLHSNELKCVKIFRKCELNQYSLEMIRKEVQLSRAIDHPNIIKVHQVLEDPDKIYLIIDDVKG